jgi:hypothetical protein
MDEPCAYFSDRVAAGGPDQPAVLCEGCGVALAKKAWMLPAVNHSDLQDNTRELNVV